MARQRKAEVILMPKKNRESKQSEIVNKARHLFWKKGYRETTIKDIADACNCLPGNIYNYFSNKEELLYRIIRQEVELLDASARSIIDNTALNPLEQLQAIVRSQVKITLGQVKTPDFLFETEIRHLSPARQKAIIKYRNKYENYIEEIIRRGVKLHIFSLADIKLASFNIIAMIVRTRLWYSPSGRLSADAIADNIIDFTLNGIGKRKR
jgi:TetR/AcrR family transcriptional regulator, cholesterol catabolism regulator